MRVRTIYTEQQYINEYIDRNRDNLTYINGMYGADDYKGHKKEIDTSNVDLYGENIDYQEIYDEYEEDSTFHIRL